MGFDPLQYVPANYNPRPERLAEITRIYEETGEPPTEEDLLAIFGPPVTIPSSIDAPPDGWAGRNWGNPDWGRKLRAKAARSDNGIYNP